MNGHTVYSTGLMCLWKFLCGALTVLLAGAAQARQSPQAHNVVIFVADGLRADSVNPKDAPTLSKLARNGVRFANPHSLYPTITTVNASAIATGHYIGDTGNFGNQLYSGFESTRAGGSVVPFLESNTVLGEMNAHFGGNYLQEDSLLAAARRVGFQTAALGKTGATAIQDVTARNGMSTIIIDNSIGTADSLPVPPSIWVAMKDAGLPSASPESGVPNVAQQSYLLSVATKVVLPAFKAAKKPFILVFWSRDPDGSQHAEKDSTGSLSPGINGPSSRSGIKNADNTLGGLLAALTSLHLQQTTDVFVTADHGFSTLDKHSQTSSSIRNQPAPRVGSDQQEPSTPANPDLPPGFLAIDLANALDLPLFDATTRKSVDYRSGQRASFGNGLIGQSAASPDIVVAANGGSDEIWLPSQNAAAFLPQIVQTLADEDYTSGIFVNDSLGEVPGTLPLSAINLKGSARTAEPALIVNFRSRVVSGCKPDLLCAVEAADTSLSTGQGMHGSFSRADTKNFMAAFGPDFRTTSADAAPVSNADIAPTLAHVLGIRLASRGRLPGRVITEALRDGKRVSVTRGWLASRPAANGMRTILNYQQVTGTRYFDAAGYPGRTVGLVSH